MCRTCTSLHFSSTHGSKKWHGATHSHAHSECFIKLHLSSQMCLHKPPKKRNTDRDEDHCISVAVQLISEIRWRPFREMRTESESWRKGERESAQPKVMGQMLKERQARRQTQKHSHKIRGRDSFGSVCLSHFLYYVRL